MAGTTPYWRCGQLAAMSFARTTTKGPVSPVRVGGLSTAKPQSTTPRSRHASVRHASVRHASVRHASVRHASVRHAGQGWSALDHSPPRDHTDAGQKGPCQSAVARSGHAGSPHASGPDGYVCHQWRRRNLQQSLRLRRLWNRVVPHRARQESSNADRRRPVVASDARGQPSRCRDPAPVTPRRGRAAVAAGPRSSRPVG
jgi:hypothetical protein